MPRLRFTLKVPASSANIGPGFDVLGIGLNLYLEVTVSIESARDTSSDPHGAILSYEGSLAEKVPLQSNCNLVTQAALYVMRCNGINAFPSGTYIHVKNPIPLGRGLGSSAAAIVAGVMLGNEIGDLAMSKARMMDYCLLIERHPDNLAAALLGGFVGSYMNDLNESDKAKVSVPLETILIKPGTPKQDWVCDAPPVDIGEYVKYPWSPDVKCIAVIPQFELSTDLARSVLPNTFSRLDIIFNLQRLAVLTSALSQTPPQPRVIYLAMKDKLHQPYRAKLIPGFEKVLESITPENNPGLCGICLSGAGPTILCLATDGFEKIARDVIEIFKKAGVECEWQLLEPATEGAIVEY